MRTQAEQDRAYARTISKNIRELRTIIDGLAKAHEPTIGLLGLANKCQCEWHKKWRTLRGE